MVSYCLVCAVLKPRVKILRRGRTYVAGRDPKADFALPSDVISRRHAEIVWQDDGAIAVRDLGSKNGTRVNEIPVIGTRALRDGDRISIGPFTMQFREYQGDIGQLLEEEPEGANDATVALSRDALAGALAGGAGGFTGNFSGQEILEIARLIGMGEKTGVLTIRGGSVVGQIAFDKGDICRAVAGPHRGETAVYELLSCGQGRFEFVGGADPQAKECRIRTEGIAMEVARRLDEHGQRTPEPPAVLGAGTPPTETGQTALEFNRDEIRKRLEGK